MRMFCRRVFLIGAVLTPSLLQAEMLTGDAFSPDGMHATSHQESTAIFDEHLLVERDEILATSETTSNFEAPRAGSWPQRASSAENLTRAASLQPAGSLESPGVNLIETTDLIGRALPTERVRIQEATRETLWSFVARHSLWCLPLFGLACTGLQARRPLLSIKNRRRHVLRYADCVEPELPPCLQALGVRFPCGEEEIKRAYRQRVMVIHPDHGGNVDRFKELQGHFEQALRLVNSQKPGSTR